MIPSIGRQRLKILAAFFCLRLTAHAAAPYSSQIEFPKQISVPGISREYQGAIHNMIASSPGIGTLDTPLYFTATATHPENSSNFRNHLIRLNPFKGSTTLVQGADTLPSSLSAPATGIDARTAYIFHTGRSMDSRLYYLRHELIYGVNGWYQGALRMCLMENNGTLIPSFGNMGCLFISAPPDYPVSLSNPNAAFQFNSPGADGSLLMTMILHDTPFPSPAVAKILPTGEIDLAFGKGGLISSNLEYSVPALLRTPSEEIFLAGVEKNAVEIAIEKYTRTGTPDHTFGVKGSAKIPFPSSVHRNGTPLAMFSYDNDLIVLFEAPIDNLMPPVVDRFLVKLDRRKGTLIRSFGNNGFVLLTPNHDNTLSSGPNAAALFFNRRTNKPAVIVCDSRIGNSQTTATSKVNLFSGKIESTVTTKGTFTAAVPLYGEVTFLLSLVTNGNLIQFIKL